MILNRNSGLWTGAVQAILNVVAAAYVVLANVPLSAADAALFLALNACGAALVGLAANASDPTTAGILGARTSASPSPGPGITGT